MKYKFCDNIRFRLFDEKSFLINIKDNSIMTINTKTLKYLQEHNDVSLDDSKLYDFVNSLIECNVLEVLNEN